MYHFSFKEGVLFCTALSLQLANANSTEPTPVYELDEYVVSAGPVPQSISEFAAPVDLIDQATLQRNAAASLGESLSWQPGVSASSFASGASRPILRGFDGPRVRILDSGIEALDASATSPDHGVAVEPLLIERVEILRGPATLLYGSSAIGGAVNTIGREIPQAPVPNGSTGGIEARYDTASHGKSYLGYTQFGTEQWALSFTGLSRRSDDYDIPGHANSDGTGSRGTLENSFVETDSFSAGGSWFFQNDSHFGLAYSEYDSLYGVPGEDVSIDLKRDKLEAELEVNEPSAFIEAFRIRAAYTDYQHMELEGPDVGTIFENDGWELRAEAAHAPLALFTRGLFGAQTSQNHLSALGDEAFTPPATTRNHAVFITEHIDSGDQHYEFGARIEQQSVDVSGSPESYDDLALSIAASWIWDLTENHSLKLSLQRAQRHPTSTELYARGPHLATEQYELGDDDLELETAYGIDLGFETKYERWSASVSAFYTVFDDYIFAQDLGYQTDVAGITEFDPGFDPAEALDTYQFTAVDAVFWGFEAELSRTLQQSSNSELVLSLLGDYVEAENRDADDALPRMPPLRIGARIDYSYGTWQMGGQLRYAFDHENTAPGETDTEGYTQFDLNLSKTFLVNQNMTWTLFVNAQNLLDEEIRYSTSFLKDSAPQPGRNFSLGARLEF